MRVEAARHNDVAIDVVHDQRSAGERARRRQQQRSVGAEHAVVATNDVDRVDRTLLARRKVGRKHGGARVETVAANDEDERRRLDERHVRRDAVGHRRQRHHRQCRGDDLDRRQHDLRRRVRALANAAHHRDRLAVGRRGGDAAVARLVHVEPTGLQLVVGTNDFDDANGAAVERTAANDDGGEAAGALEKTAARVAARHESMLAL
jgi:hypothetical protein